jgi:hypothetical protein
MRKPDPFAFARVLSTMMHPAPVTVLGLLVMVLAMNSGRER